MKALNVLCRMAKAWSSTYAHSHWLSRQRPASCDQNLLLFSERRNRGDLIITYRTLDGLFYADLGNIFSLNNDIVNTGSNFRINSKEILPA